MAISFLLAWIILNHFYLKSYGDSSAGSLTGVKGAGLNAAKAPGADIQILVRTVSGRYSCWENSNIEKA
jgi:hypothetical protein